MLHLSKLDTFFFSYVVIITGGDNKEKNVTDMYVRGVNHVMEGGSID